MSARNVLAVIAITVAVAAAQPARPDVTALTAELNSMCRQVQQTEQAEAGILEAHKSAAVNGALASEADFWRFLTSPSTNYRDRMVAARLGGGLIGLDRLTELWKAQADLDRPRVPRVLSPCDYVMSANIRPEHWLIRHNGFASGASRPQSRFFSGQDLTKPFDYPVTQDERDQAPWLWQIERMMPVLANAVATYYAQPGRYPAMAEVAWNWQTSDWWEASVRERALVRGPRNAAWLQNLIRLALERQSETGVGAVSSLYVFGSDSDHFEELVHVAQIVIMQRTRRRDVADAAAFAIAQLATSPLKPLRTSTGILAIARWALNGEVDAWSRYIGYAGAICRMVPDAPYRPEQSAFGDKGRIAGSLGAFEVWFSKQRPLLEEAVAAERAHLLTLAAELHETIE